jgi:hypothetical protein
MEQVIEHPFAANGRWRPTTNQLSSLHGAM